MRFHPSATLRNRLAAMPGPRWVCAFVVVVGLGVDAYWWSDRFMAPPARGTVTSFSSPQAVSRNLTALFGAPAAAPGGTEIVGAATSSPLTLTGTLAFLGAEHLGFAIVSVSGQARLVAVGGAVGAGRLSAVFVDHIVVEQDGRLLSLPLPRTAGGYGALGGGDESLSSANAIASPNEPSGEELKARVTSALAPLASVFRAEPLLSDEAYRGLVVNPNGNAYAFGHMGLKAGDSIMGVNGFALTQDNLELFPDEIRSGRPVKISLLRPGVGMVEVTLNTTGIYVGPKGAAR